MFAVHEFNIILQLLEIRSFQTESQEQCLDAINCMIAVMVAIQKDTLPFASSVAETPKNLKL